MGLGLGLGMGLGLGLGLGLALGLGLGLGLGIGLGLGLGFEHALDLGPLLEKELHVVDAPVEHGAWLGIGGHGDS